MTRRRTIDDLTPKAALPGKYRQAFPVGDEFGEVIQAVNPLPVEQNVADWTQETTLTVANTVVQLDSAFRSSNNYCIISIETAAVRYWLGGKVPTATVGQLLNVGDILTLETEDELNDIQFIRQSGTNATLYCSFGNRR